MRVRLFALSLLACLLASACVGGGDAGPFADLHLQPAHDTPADGRAVAVDPAGGMVYLAPGLTIAGADIVSVHVGADPDPVLDIHVGAAAGRRIEALTANQIGKRLAITANDRVLAVATITGPVSDAIRISGETMEEVATMRNAMREPAADTAP